MARKLRQIIRGLLFFGLAVFFISGGFSIPGSDSKVIGFEPESSSKDPLPEYPVVRIAMVDPIKVVPGDTMTISAEIEDRYGVREVTVDMGGIETVKLELVKGTIYHGHWQSKWLVHDTEQKEYVATFKIVNFKWQEAQALVYWADAYCACGVGGVGPAKLGGAYIQQAQINATEVQNGDYTSGATKCSDFTGFTFAIMRIGESAQARVLFRKGVIWGGYGIGFFWDSDMDGDLDSSDASGVLTSICTTGLTDNTWYSATFTTGGHSGGPGSTRWRYFVINDRLDISCPGPCSVWANYGEIEDYTVKFCSGDGSTCSAAANCCSNKCLGSKCCPTNHCSNSTQDCDETGIDCGGAECAACCKANGQTCTLFSQCCSNLCVDGYCCNSSCGFTCQACNLTGYLGTCTNISSGQDPSNECALGSYSCSGSCQRTQAPGYCNGSGACAGAITYNITDGYVCSGGNEVSPSSSVYCASVTSCTNNTCTADSYYRACNGSGACRSDNTYAYYEALTNKVCVNGLFTTTVGVPWYLSTTCNLNNVNISLQDDLYVQNGGTLNLTGTTNITTSCDADSCGDYVYVYTGGTVYVDDTAGFNK